MPPNRMANIRRKVHYSHHCLTRAMQHIADLYVTVKPAHPDEAAVIREQLTSLDRERDELVYLYRRVWAGTEKPFRDDPALHEILAGAAVVPDPKRRTPWDS